MNKFVGLPRRSFICGTLIAASIFLTGIARRGWPAFARNAQETAKLNDDASLLEGFRHVEAASVSDALEQISERKMYMSHRMRPIFPSKFAGFALTVLLKKESNRDPDALKGMLAAIDQGDRKSTRLNSSHRTISYAVFCLKKKKILIEKCIKGFDFRFLVINYKLEAVARRTPAMVICYDHSSIKQLIDTMNNDSSRCEEHV